MADRRRRPPPAWLLVPHEQKARLECVAGAPLQVVRYTGLPPAFFPFEDPSAIAQVEPAAGAEGVGVEMLLLQQLTMGAGHG